MRNRFLVVMVIVNHVFLNGILPCHAKHPKNESISVLVLLGEWFGDVYFSLAEEIETRGWTMKRIGVDAEYRGCYNKDRDVVLRSDILIPGLVDFSGFDCLIIPSGPQWRKFNNNPHVLRFVREAHDAGLLIASFCVGNFTVKAAGLFDMSITPDDFPTEVIEVKERILLGPRGGGPPPGDGYESAPVKEICDAIARELENKKKDEPFSALKCPYLGQKPPGMTPEVFAPGIINTAEKNHSSVTVSPDCREIYWSKFSIVDSVRQERIWYTSVNRNSVWSAPQVAPFSGTYRDGQPSFSPDGTRIYFSSLRPVDQYDDAGDANIWYTEKTGSGWGIPQCLGPAVNTEHQEWFPSVARNGNVYYALKTGEKGSSWNIQVARYRDGTYEKSEYLGDTVNSPFNDMTPYIDPDERFIVFFSERPTGRFIDGRLHISFRNGDGSWSEAQCLGRSFDASGTRFPNISADGKYFFFTKLVNESEDVYWVSAKIIDALKPDALN